MTPGNPQLAGTANRPPRAARMSVTDALTSRRSHPRLSEPAPDDAELLALIEAAASAPDHGRLRPWRLIVLRGGGREKLGEALAADRPLADRPRQLAKVLRAPLLVSIVFCPVTGSKVPRWEQLSTIASIVYGLSLALHGHGYASIWRTGDLLSAPAVREFLELAPAEELLGWLFVGTPSDGQAPGPRPVIDMVTKVAFHDGR